MCVCSLFALPGLVNLRFKSLMKPPIAAASSPLNAQDGANAIHANVYDRDEYPSQLQALNGASPPLIKRKAPPTNNLANSLDLASSLPPSVTSATANRLAAGPLAQ